MAIMTKAPMFEKEFAYSGEIGKWKGLMDIKWIFIRDLYFSDIGYMKEKKKDISELKDGTSLSLNNALILIEKFNKIKEKSDIFVRFPQLDKNEKDVRSKADSMIKTGKYDIYVKRQHEEKKQYLQQLDEKEKAKAKEKPKSVVAVMKKLTQDHLLKQYVEQVWKNKEDKATQTPIVTVNNNLAESQLKEQHHQQVQDKEESKKELPFLFFDKKKFIESNLRNQHLQQARDNEEAKEEQTPVVAIKKKLTQGQLKKLKKQQNKRYA